MFHGFQTFDPLGLHQFLSTDEDPQVEIFGVFGPTCYILKLHNELLKYSKCSSEPLQDQLEPSVLALSPQAKPLSPGHPSFFNVAY